MRRDAHEGMERETVFLASLIHFKRKRLIHGIRKLFSHFVSNLKTDQLKYESDLYNLFDVS